MRLFGGIKNLHKVSYRQKLIETGFPEEELDNWPGQNEGFEGVIRYGEKTQNLSDPISGASSKQMNEVERIGTPYPCSDLIPPVTSDVPVPTANPIAAFIGPCHTLMNSDTYSEHPANVRATHLIGDAHRRDYKKDITHVMNDDGSGILFQAYEEVELYVEDIEVDTIKGIAQMSGFLFGMQGVLDSVSSITSYFDTKGILSIDNSKLDFANNPNYGRDLYDFIRDEAVHDTFACFIKNFHAAIAIDKAVRTIRTLQKVSNEISIKCHHDDDIKKIAAKATNQGPFTKPDALEYFKDLAYTLDNDFIKSVLDLIRTKRKVANKGIFEFRITSSDIKEAILDLVGKEGEEKVANYLVLYTKDLIKFPATKQLGENTFLNGDLIYNLLGYDGSGRQIWSSTTAQGFLSFVMGRAQCFLNMFTGKLTSMARYVPPHSQGLKLIHELSKNLEKGGQRGEAAQRLIDIQQVAEDFPWCDYINHFITAIFEICKGSPINAAQFPKMISTLCTVLAAAGTLYADKHDKRYTTEGIESTKMPHTSMCLPEVKAYLMKVLKKIDTCRDEYKSTTYAKFLSLGYEYKANLPEFYSGQSVEDLVGHQMALIECCFETVIYGLLSICKQVVNLNMLQYRKYPYTLEEIMNYLSGKESPIVESYRKRPAYLDGLAEQLGDELKDWHNEDEERPDYDFLYIQVEGKLEDYEFRGSIQRTLTTRTNDAVTNVIGPINASTTKMKTSVPLIHQAATGLLKQFEKDKDIPSIDPVVKKAMVGAFVRQLHEVVMQRNPMSGKFFTAKGKEEILCKAITMFNDLFDHYNYAELVELVTSGNKYNLHRGLREFIRKKVIKKGEDISRGVLDIQQKITGDRDYSTSRELPHIKRVNTAEIGSGNYWRKFGRKITFNIKSKARPEYPKGPFSQMCALLRIIEAVVANTIPQPAHFLTWCDKSEALTPNLHLWGLFATRLIRPQPVDMTDASLSVHMTTKKLSVHKNTVAHKLPPYIAELFEAHEIFLNCKVKEDETIMFSRKEFEAMTHKMDNSKRSRRLRCRIVKDKVVQNQPAYYGVFRAIDGGEIHEVRRFILTDAPLTDDIAVTIAVLKEGEAKCRPFAKTPLDVRNLQPSLIAKTQNMATLFSGIKLADDEFAQRDHDENTTKRAGSCSFTLDCQNFCGSMTQGLEEELCIISGIFLGVDYAIAGIQRVLRSSAFLPSTRYHPPMTHSPSLYALPSQSRLLGSAQGMNQAIWSCIINALVSICWDSYTVVLPAIKGDNIIISSRGHGIDDMGSYLIGLLSFNLLARGLGITLSAKETVCARQSHNNCQKITVFGNQMSSLVKGTITALLEPESGNLDIQDYWSNLLDKAIGCSFSEPHASSTVVLMGFYLYASTAITPGFMPNYGEIGILIKRDIIGTHLGGKYINTGPSLVPEVFMFANGKDKNTYQFVSFSQFKDDSDEVPLAFKELALNALKRPEDPATLYANLEDPSMPRYKFKRATGGDKIDGLNTLLKEKSMANSVKNADLDLEQLDSPKVSPEAKILGRMMTEKLNLEGVVSSISSTEDAIDLLGRCMRDEDVLFRAQSSVMSMLATLNVRAILSKITDSQDNKDDTNFLKKASQMQMDSNQFEELFDHFKQVPDEYYDEMEQYSDSEDFIDFEIDEYTEGESNSCRGRKDVIFDAVALQKYHNERSVRELATHFSKFQQPMTMKEVLPTFCETNGVEIPSNLNPSIISETVHHICCRLECTDTTTDDMRNHATIYLNPSKAIEDSIKETGHKAYVIRSVTSQDRSPCSHWEQIFNIEGSEAPMRMKTRTINTSNSTYVKDSAVGVSQLDNAAALLLYSENMIRHATDDLTREQQEKLDTTRSEDIIASARAIKNLALMVINAYSPNGESQQAVEQLMVEGQIAERYSLSHRSKVGLKDDVLTSHSRGRNARHFIVYRIQDPDDDIENNQVESEFLLVLKEQLSLDLARIAAHENQTSIYAVVVVNPFDSKPSIDTWEGMRNLGYTKEMILPHSVLPNLEVGRKKQGKDLRTALGFTNFILNLEHPFLRELGFNIAIAAITENGIYQQCSLQAGQKIGTINGGLNFELRQMIDPCIYYALVFLRVATHAGLVYNDLVLWLRPGDNTLSGDNLGAFHAKGIGKKILSKIPELTHFIASCVDTLVFSGSHGRHTSFLVPGSHETGAPGESVEDIKEQLGYYGGKTWTDTQANIRDQVPNLMVSFKQFLKAVIKLILDDRFALRIIEVIVGCVPAGSCSNLLLDCLAGFGYEFMGTLTSNFIQKPEFHKNAALREFITTGERASKCVVRPPLRVLAPGRRKLESGKRLKFTHPKKDTDEATFVAKILEMTVHASTLSRFWDVITEIGQLQEITYVIIFGDPQLELTSLLAPALPTGSKILNIHSEGPRIEHKCRRDAGTILCSCQKCHDKIHCFHYDSLPRDVFETEKVDHALIDYMPTSCENVLFLSDINLASGGTPEDRNAENSRLIHMLLQHVNNFYKRSNSCKITSYFRVSVNTQASMELDITTHQLSVIYPRYGKKTDFKREIILSQSFIPKVSSTVQHAQDLSIVARLEDDKKITMGIVREFIRLNLEGGATMTLSSLFLLQNDDFLEVDELSKRVQIRAIPETDQSYPLAWRDVKAVMGSSKNKELLDNFAKVGAQLYAFASKTKRNVDSSYIRQVKQLIITTAVSHWLAKKGITQESLCDQDDAFTL